MLDDQRGALAREANLHIIEILHKNAAAAHRCRLHLHLLTACAKGIDNDGVGMRIAQLNGFDRIRHAFFRRQLAAQAHALIRYRQPQQAANYRTIRAVAFPGFGE